MNGSASKEFTELGRIHVLTRLIRTPSRLGKAHCRRVYGLLVLRQKP